MLFFKDLEGKNLSVYKQYKNTADDIIFCSYFKLFLEPYIAIQQMIKDVVDLLHY